MPPNSEAHPGAPASGNLKDYPPRGFSGGGSIVVEASEPSGVR